MTGNASEGVRKAIEDVRNLRLYDPEPWRRFWNGVEGLGDAEDIGEER